MTHTDLIAIEKFAERLKINFPILLKPKDFNERILNITNESVRARIDLAVEQAKLDFDIQANEEAKHYGN